MANNASYSLGPISNGVRLNAVAVTPGATTYNPPLTKLWVGVTGNISLTMAQTGTAVLLSNVPVGWINDVAVYSIPSSGTTATDIVGFF